MRSGDFSDLSKAEVIQRWKRAALGFWIAILLWTITTLSLARCLGVI